MSLFFLRSLTTFLFFFFFFNDTATTEIYTLSLHDALPISLSAGEDDGGPSPGETIVRAGGGDRCPRREWQGCGLSARSRADRGLGKAPRPDSRRRDCTA